MAKRGVEEVVAVAVEEKGGAMAVVVEEKEQKEKEENEKEEEEAHPYAFHVSGPRNVAKPNWRDLINSSW